MFKLIREAQLVDRLGDKLEEATKLQTLLKKDSLLDVADMFEGLSDDFAVQPEDYQKWMEVLQDEANDRGIELNKKQNFEDLAHLMLENDPRVDELGLDDLTRQRIVKALWSSYKASAAHANVTKGVARAIDTAREEEEKVSRSSWVATGGKKNPYQPGSLRHALWADINGAEDEELEVDVGQRPSLDIADLAATERTSIPGEEGVPGDSDVEQRVADLESRVADIEAGEAEEPWHDDDEMNGAESDVEFGDNGEEEHLKAVDFEGSAPRAPARVTVEDEETVKKNLFRKAITAPRTELTQALKDVEAEGVEAWKKMQLAKNPHPQKTQAYNAWMKGFRNSAKDALGIVDKPVLKPVKKPAGAKRK